MFVHLVNSPFPFRDSSSQQTRFQPNLDLDRARRDNLPVQILSLVFLSHMCVHCNLQLESQQFQTSSEQVRVLE